METRSNKPAFARLTEQLERYPSLDKLHVQRNLALGSSAASLVILIGVIGAGIGSLPLRVSLFACSVSIPAWIGLAGLIEYYIVLGPKSYAHRRTQLAQVLLGVLFLAGGLALIIAISGLLYHLTPSAAYAFWAADLAILFMSFGFHAHLAHWYNRPGDSAERQPDSPDK